jgi:hypothetical protein
MGGVEGTCDGRSEAENYGTVAKPIASVQKADSRDGRRLVEMEGKVEGAWRPWDDAGLVMLP